jgi:hypothetical protein
MHFGPNLSYLESFKGRVPEKLKLEQTYMIKKIPLIYENRREFLICCRSSSIV